MFKLNNIEYDDDYYYLSIATSNQCTFSYCLEAYISCCSLYNGNWQRHGKYGSNLR